MRGRRLGTKRILTGRELERQRETDRKMLSLNLEAHLHNLVREIGERGADTFDKLAEFQQMIQYAPPEMCVRMLAVVALAREKKQAEVIA